MTVVEASFSYHCAGTGAGAAAPVYGSVVTWHKKVKGSLECGHEPRSRYGREAYETVCGGRAP
ncbi:hypothetical protein [Streptomyces sp. CAU 1734]|uniref:hypothetical protein n=1 Tax=Streptomyces sp. CAU 1734 TaxID=3140360 RepID=UPI0032604F5F